MKADDIIIKTSYSYKGYHIYLQGDEDVVSIVPEFEETIRRLLITNKPKNRSLKCLPSTTGKTKQMSK